MGDSTVGEMKAGAPGLNIPSPLIPLTAGIKKVYLSGEHSDLVISCKGREWNVHRVLLCSQSEWFQKALSGAFMEAEERKIKLDDDDDDPQTVDALLHYFYNFDYGDYGNSQQHVSPLVLDVRIFAIADKMFIDPLKQLAADKFTKRAEAIWGTDEFAAAIMEVYSMIPAHEETLKRIVIRIVKEHAGDLFSENKGYDAFKRAVGEMAEFGADVLGALPLQHVGVKWYRCPNCACEFAVKDTEGVAFDCPARCYGQQKPSWWEDKIVKE